MPWVLTIIHEVDGTIFKNKTLDQFLKWKTTHHAVIVYLLVVMVHEAFQKILQT